MHTAFAFKHFNIRYLWIIALSVNLTGLSGCNRKPTTVSLNPTSGVLAVGLTEQFTPMGYYSNDKELPLTDATWSIARPDIASVSATGLVTAHNVGKTELVATVAGFTVKAPITVTPVAVQSIELTPSGATVALGTTFTFIPNVHYSDGSSQLLGNGAQAPNSRYHTLWHSDNAEVASVDENGVVTAHQASGSATISMGLGEVIGMAKVKVTPASISNIYVSTVDGVVTPGTGNVHVKVGNSLQLTALGTSSTNITSELSKSGNKVTWECEDPSIAIISSNGVVKGVNQGNSRIRLSSSGFRSEIGVIVE